MLIFGYTKNVLHVIESENWDLNNKSKWYASFIKLMLLGCKNFYTQIQECQKWHWSGYSAIQSFKDWGQN